MHLLKFSKYKTFVKRKLVDLFPPAAQAHLPFSRVSCSLILGITKSIAA